VKKKFSRISTPGEKRQKKLGITPIPKVDNLPRNVLNPGGSK